MADRWWAPQGAHVGPDASDLSLLEPGDEVLHDLGASLMALHRVGAAACEAVSRGPIPDEVALITALATARGAFAEPLVDSVSKSLNDATYAGLLVRDVFDDAEQGALDLFRAAVAKQVAPPIAAQRAGLVYGVPREALAPYLRIATDPRANPAMIADTADRVLFAHVEKVCREESAEVLETVSKAPAAERPRVRSNDAEVAEAAMRQAVTQDDPTTPEYDARDRGGRFARVGQTPATADVSERQPNESIGAYTLRLRRAGRSAAPAVAPDRKPVDRKPVDRMAADRRAPDRAAADRRPADRSAARTRGEARTNTAARSNARVRRSANTRTANQVRSNFRTRQQEQAFRDADLAVSADRSVEIYGKGNWMDKPKPDDVGLYTVSEQRFGLVVAGPEGRQMIGKMLGSGIGEDKKRFRLGHIEGYAGAGFRLADSEENADVEGYTFVVRDKADQLFKKLETNARNSGASPAEAALRGERHHSKRIPAHMFEDANVRSEDERQNFITKQKLQMAGEYVEDELQIFQDFEPEKYRSAVMMEMPYIADSADLTGGMGVTLVHHANGKPPLSVYEFLIEPGARVSADTTPDTSPRLDPNAIYTVEQIRSQDRVYDDDAQIWRQRVRLRRIDEDEALDIGQKFRKAERTRVRTNDAEVAEAAMEQALTPDDPATDYYDARSRGRFARTNGPFRAVADRTATDRSSSDRRRADRSPETVRRSSGAVRSESPTRSNREQRRSTGSRLNRVPRERRMPLRTSDAIRESAPQITKAQLSDSIEYLVMSESAFLAMKANVGDVIHGPARTELLKTQTYKGSDVDQLLRTKLDDHLVMEDVDTVYDELVDGVEIDPSRPESLSNYHGLVERLFAGRPALQSLDFEYKGHDTYRINGTIAYGIEGHKPERQVIIETSDDVDLGGPLELIHLDSLKAHQMTRDFDPRPGTMIADPYRMNVDVWRLQRIPHGKGNYKLEQNWANVPTELRYPGEGGKPPTWKLPPKQ